MSRSKSKKEQWVLAIDPGIANTGWAEFCNGKRVTSGCLETSPKNSIQSRIGSICQRLADIDHNSTVVVEDFVGSLGRKTVWLIGAILGYNYQKEIVLVLPRRWPKELHGAGLDKDVYKQKSMLLATAGGHTPKTQHEADAICIGLWYLNGKRDTTCQQKSKNAPTTKKQRIKLSSKTS